MTTFDVAFFRAQQRRRKLTLGAPITAMAETGSTNDDALAAARSGAREGATFSADFQTEGRGRQGNPWLAPASENLTFSVLLRPKIPPERAPLLTLGVGLAVRDVAARQLPGERVGIKWPNDVWVGQRKLAGVLLESVVQSGQLSAVIVGVGLNVGTVTFPAELATTAVSLAQLGGEERREVLLLEALEGIEHRVGQIVHGGLPAILPELGEHDVLEGRRIKVDEVHGTAAGLTASGELILETEHGVQHVRAGHVELLP